MKPCEETCTNTPGSYICTCTGTKLSLAEDKKTCFSMYPYLFIIILSYDHACTIIASSSICTGRKFDLKTRRHALVYITYMSAIYLWWSELGIGLRAVIMAWSEKLRAFKTRPCHCK